MKSKIINGKEIAAKINDESMQLLHAHLNKRNPKLVIFYFGYNASSEIYIKYKCKSASKFNIDVDVIHELNASEQDMINLISKANADHDVDAIMVQLPINIPQINVQKVLDTIDINKDVDGLTSWNLGQVWTRNDYLLASCTALACMQVFKEINYDLQGKQVCIIGSTIVLGKPLAGMLNQLHATVSLLNSFTPSLTTYTKFADVIVSATGIKHLLSKEMVKKDVVLIDVGSNKDENNVTHGDFDPTEFTDIASVISPSPGGIGPITISMLMHNVIKAYVHHLARTNNKGD